MKSIISSSWWAGSAPSSVPWRTAWVMTARSAGDFATLRGIRASPPTAENTFLRETPPDCLRSVPLVRFTRSSALAATPSGAVRVERGASASELAQIEHSEPMSAVVAPDGTMRRAPV